MHTQKLNIHEAKTKLSAVLAQVEKTGRKVLICHNGKPIAELAPLKKGVGLRLGKHPTMSKIQINYDPTEDMSDEEWVILNDFGHMCISMSCRQIGKQ